MKPVLLKFILKDGKLIEQKFPVLQTDRSYFMLQQVVDCIKTEPETHAQSTILQLDFQKVFDRVNHDFLEKRLKEIKMPGNIINGIMLLVTKQYGQVSINQFIGSSFDIQQGLRQGDPLSPLLFSLVMDSFNRTVSSSLEGIMYCLTILDKSSPNDFDC
ncbi:unnamed protein product [Ambrosiozyma monospora]|uniref:Unnamed protein product n=1 Tax=Ambrosiozyma monospora TaxID=43982 RepID=A0A9W6YWW2_AMBMO|nr:unnamed protein product [Ambrosiozyma monospora]